MTTYEIQIYLDGIWQPYMGTTAKKWKEDLKLCEVVCKSSFPTWFVDDKVRAVKQVNALRVLQ